MADKLPPMFPSPHEVWERFGFEPRTRPQSLSEAARLYRMAARTEIDGKTVMPTVLLSVVVVRLHDDGEGDYEVPAFEGTYMTAWESEPE